MRMELNDKESKITLYSFGLAFFISFIIGIIVGNPFGIALVRAFLASFVFAMVVFGVIYILKKYIPEIFEISRMGRGVEKGGDSNIDASERGTESLNSKFTVESAGKKADSGGEKVNILVGDEGESNQKDKAEGVGRESEEFAREEFGVVEVGKKGKKDKKGAVSDIGNETPEGEKNEEELPPIEELLGEEEDIPPEIQTEDETLSEGRGVKSDYIEVGNVRIPNEPELLAKAIEKVMKEDES